MTGKTVLFKLPEVTVANLPSSHPLSIVTNGSAADDCVKGGGAFRVLCAWNGSAWASIGGGGGGTGDVTDVLQTANEVCVTNPGGPQPQVGLCSTLALTAKTLQVGRVDLAGDITPTTLAANTNDWNPTSLATASTIRISASSAVNLTGLQGGVDGRILTIYNAGSFAITLKAGDANSATANRFAFVADQVLQPNQGIVIQYDSVVTGGKWRALTGAGVPSDSHACAAAGGSGTAYTCTLSPALGAYVTNAHYFFKADVPNTGAATIAFNGLAAITIKKPVGGVTTDLIANDIRANQIVEVVYDGTNMQMVSQLGNSPTGVSGLTPGTVPQAATVTTLSDSTYSQDANYAYVGKPIVQGNCDTHCASHNFSAVTGQKTFTWPNHAGTVPISPNARKAIQIALFDAGTDVTSGNGKFYLRVPTLLNGMNLVAIDANVVTAGTTNPTSVQITRCVAAASGNACSGTTASMLTTVVSVDSGENSSTTAATPAVIDTSNDDVATGQLLRFDVTAVSTTAPKGLTINLEFELP